MTRKLLAFLLVATALIVVGYTVKADPKFTGIVASKEFASQTNDFSNQTLWTADSDSLVRVTVFAENSSHIGGVSLQVVYTDTFGTGQSNTYSSFGGNTAFIFKAKSGTAVQLTSGGISGLGASVNAYAVVERLE